jgi:hypothetical protein
MTTLNFEEHSFKGVAEVLWITNAAVRRNHRSVNELIDFMKDHTLELCSQWDGSGYHMWGTYGFYIYTSRDRHSRAVLAYYGVQDYVIGKGD